VGDTRNGGQRMSNGMGTAGSGLSKYKGNTLNAKSNYKCPWRRLLGNDCLVSDSSLFAQHSKK
jgi:hypothetical protein